MEENFLSRLARLKVGDGGDFFLFNQNRQMIVHRDPEKLLGLLPTKGVRELLDRVVGGYQGTGEMVNPSGRPSIYSFKRLSSTGWILPAERPREVQHAQHADEVWRKQRKPLRAAGECERQEPQRLHECRPYH